MPAVNLTRNQLVLLGCTVICVAIASYFLAQPAGPNIGYADANKPEQIAAGKILYAENCASCHGGNLEGQKNWRQPLAEGGLPAPPHDETGHTWHHPNELLFRYTKLGGQAIAPAGFKSNMPGFSETMSDDQIWAVLAYIKSQWPEKIRRRHTQFNQQSKKK
jgi:mono/diheme cytochrome c family protein